MFPCKGIVRGGERRCERVKAGPMAIISGAIMGLLQYLFRNSLSREPLRLGGVGNGPERGWGGEYR